MTYNVNFFFIKTIICGSKQNIFQAYRVIVVSLMCSIANYTQRVTHVFYTNFALYLVLVFQFLHTYNTYNVMMSIKYQYTL